MNLRLFVSPDDRRESTAGISPRMRLGEFADRYFFPVCLPPAIDPDLEKAHARTRAEYRKTLDYWKQFTRDPPLEEITAADCASFLGTLQTVRGRKGAYLSPETMAKHRRNLRTLLRKAGPKRFDRQTDELNAALIADLPAVRTIPRPEPEEKPFLKPDQLAAIWKAADQMTGPRIPSVAAPLWWRVTLRTFYELGLRAEETFALEWGFVQERDGATFLVIPAKKRKGRKRKLVAMVSPELLALWRSIRRGKSRLILRAVNARTGQPFDQGYLYRTWRRLLSKAGIEGHDLGFHVIRRTHANSLDTETAQQSLGHSSDRITKAHYQSAYTNATKIRGQLPEFWRDAADPIQDDPAGD